jgi:FkbM family methyltransferase
MRSPIGPGLSDCWCSVSHAIQFAEKIGTKWQLCSTGDTLRKLREILPLLQGHERIEIVEGEAKPLRGQVWEGPRVSTMIKWTGQGSKIVTYQFDAVTKPGRKNFTAEDEAKLLQALKDLGLEPIQLGAHLSLSEAVSLMSMAAMHVGIDSGFAHVGLSVGLPVIVAQNRFHRVGHYYWKTEAIIVTGWKEMIDKVAELRGLVPLNGEIPELLPEYETAVVGGLTFKCRSNDPWIIRHGFLYPLPPDKMLKTVVDIGAHVGGFSARILNLFPDVSLYSVEPTEESYTLLSANAAGSNLTRAAIGDPSIGGFKTADVSMKNTGGVSYWETGIDIPIIDPLTYLQDIIDKHGNIDVLKCDCEGGEWSLFERAGHLFDKIDYALFEIHINCLGIYFKENGPDLSTSEKMVRYVESKTGMKCSVFTSNLRAMTYEVILTK